jgi:hypothetical protein
MNIPTRDDVLNALTILERSEIMSNYITSRMQGIELRLTEEMIELGYEVETQESGIFGESNDVIIVASSDTVHHVDDYGSGMDVAMRVARAEYKNGVWQTTVTEHGVFAEE